MKIFKASKKVRKEKSKVHAAKPAKQDEALIRKMDNEPAENQEAWTVIYNDPYIFLYDIHAFSDKDIIAVGRYNLGNNNSSPCVLRYDGTTWNRELVSTGFSADYLQCIAAVSPQEVFVGSNTGVIMRYTQGSWTKSYQHTHQGSPIEGIWAASSNDVYATVTYDNIIIHYDGTAWSVAYTTPLDPEWNSRFNLYGMWGFENSVYAVGRKSILVNGYGQSFTSKLIETTNPQGLLTIWGTSGQDLFAAGDFGRIYHSDGASWSRMSHPYDVDGDGYVVLKIRGNSSNDVYAIEGVYGEKDHLLHYDGGQWTEESGVSQDNLTSLSAAPSGEIYVCDIHGVIAKTSQNNPPTAPDYKVSANKDTPVSGRVEGTDPDGDILTYSLNSAPTYGTAQVNSDGTWTYTPNTGVTGTDNFKVLVSDGKGGTTLSTITITIKLATILTVIRPNGGEVWVAGTTNAIQWSYTGKLETVKIELLRNDILNLTITQSVPAGRSGNGSYSWRIPVNLADSELKIRITSNENTSITDTSDRNFSVIGMWSIIQAIWEIIRRIIGFGR